MDKIIAFATEYGVIFYLIFISSLAFVVTVYDKIASKRLTEYRTRERTLLLVSALGGSVAMMATMLLIRHKTRHTKFMIGIPLIILLQVAAIWALLHFDVINVV